MNFSMIASTIPKRSRCLKREKIYPEKTGTFPRGGEKSCRKASNSFLQAAGIGARRGVCRKKLRRTKMKSFCGRFATAAHRKTESRGVRIPAEFAPRSCHAAGSLLGERSHAVRVSAGKRPIPRDESRPGKAKRRVQWLDCCQNPVEFQESEPVPYESRESWRSLNECTITHQRKIETSRWANTLQRGAKRRI
jgi:hypothetical protein